MPGRNVPFPPMEAELVDELPTGDWQYEPKWDGFRGVLENDGGELALWSRNGRPLLRYFPELEPLGELLPPHSALDGEIVIAREGQARLRRDADAAASGGEPDPQALGRDPGARSSPSTSCSGRAKPVHELPLEKRRARARAQGEARSALAADARPEAGASAGSTGSSRPASTA